MSLNKIDILGIPFVQTTQKEFVEELDKHMEREEKVFVVTANPEIAMKAIEDKEYRAVIEQATYITADGIGVVKAAGLLGTPLTERVTGYDSMMALLPIAERKQYRIYLLGGQQETLDKAISNIKRDYPNINIVGQHNGFFDWEKNDIQQEVIDKKPDLVFVALGVPRQENWIAQNLSSFDKGVFIGVGGSFDVVAGTVKRAPIFLAKGKPRMAVPFVKTTEPVETNVGLATFWIKSFESKGNWET